MGMLVLQWVEQCPYCNGTGLFVGAGEMGGREDYGGAAVVCNKCEGTGRREMRQEYEEFTGKKVPSADIARVWKCNPGIVLHADKCTGGVTVAEWLNDPESVNDAGAELRSHTCPAWWAQAAGMGRPDWKECDELGFGYRFSDCRHFATKAQCWMRLEQEREIPA